MSKSFFQPFVQAFQNIKSNWFHTLLSILGIVIGVAALVAILSLIDGMEQYGRDQITNTTSIKAVAIVPETYKDVNHVNVRKDSFEVLNYAAFKKMVAETGPYDRTVLSNSFYREVTVSGKSEGVGIILNGVSEGVIQDSLLKSGSLLPASAYEEGNPLAMINENMAKLIRANKSDAVEGKTFVAMGKTFTITGVVKAKNSEAPPAAYTPVSIFSDAELKLSPPNCFVEVKIVEDVPQHKKKIEQWLSKNYGDHADDFSVQTQELRVTQAAQGFLLFRIVMGLIVGISVLVGGIGVMNVLLISVNERTSEIGMRKAIGARKSDILRLFLSESILVSAMGSFLGLIVGILATMAAVPIIKAVTHLPFQADYTLNTLLVIAVVTVVIGVVFGTYPAMKAARLDPVEAIRRE